ncbi:pentapeptide repeat-containing protein [Streptomyces sp. NPDC051776]|uniref:pentapeptide repeat-containing protein n=1 Tax=Streptomyces sp. NPDC051776 TaxID=3155414 RepID=UPI00341ABAFA
MAHVDEADRATYLAALTPGADIDHRGTPFTASLLRRLLDALCAPTTERPELGQARFNEATFNGDAEFKGATFTDGVTFHGATFNGVAEFEGATFNDGVTFHGATFNGVAGFNSGTFNGYAGFAHAAFNGDAAFDEATFTDDAAFGEAAFNDTVWFRQMTFTGHALFNGATFNGHATFLDVTFDQDAQFGWVTFNHWTLFRRVTFTGSALFMGATFTRGAGFAATFNGEIWFKHTTFDCEAGFDGTIFNREAGFNKATFTGKASFDRAIFTGGARFDEATFNDEAKFDRATFNGDARFDEVTFNDEAKFDCATFNGDARFDGARFETTPQLGPLICDGTVALDRAVFGAPVTMQMASRAASCRRTRWRSTAALRLRYAEVDLAGAVLEFPVTVAAAPESFTDQHGRNLSESTLEKDRDPRVRMTALNGLDAVHLALTDVDLTDCLFAGTVNLDQLRIEGRTTFAHPPAGWHRRGPMALRWSRRRTLAEEHYWRAATADRPTPGQRPSSQEWRPGPQHPTCTPGPETIAATYRQLRKAFEDSKNEPGAADFYYGECEMRRHDHTDTTWTERTLLTVYWAISGYGLRASRALAWLAAAMTATVATMMLWGIPVDAPKPTTTGPQVHVGETLNLVTEAPDPVNPTGPLMQRATTERFEKALRVVINSVIFRSSGQDLTTAGTYTEMASRLGEPVLLGLAVLAVRSRVKR